jgi:hypothetical protein
MLFILLPEIFRDTYFTAEDARSFGVIDEVIATREGSTKKTADLKSISNTVSARFDKK